MSKFIIFFFLFIVSINGFTQDTTRTKSGLKYVSLKTGDGDHPKDGDKVKVYYHKGTLLQNGNEFDKDITTRTIRFTIGKHEVIPGWEEGFRLMKKGERGFLIIPSNLAYGKHGVKDSDDENKYEIPPDADLVFEVELLDFK